MVICFEETPPIEEIDLISFYLNRSIYVNGICQVHIDKWEGEKTANPLASALNIVEVRFGVKGIVYA